MSDDLKRLRSEMASAGYDTKKMSAPSSPVPAPEDTLDERISAIRQRCEAATPGPWVCEVQIREREETAHYQIRTVEPQPSHPWSPRFLAWMMGGRSIAPNVFKSLSPWQQSNLVDEGLRDDRKVEPDAQFIAHAREDVPWLLAEAFRLRSQLERMRVEAESQSLRADVARVIPHTDRAELDRLRADLLTPEEARAIERYIPNDSQTWAFHPEFGKAVRSAIVKLRRRLSSDSK